MVILSFATKNFFTANNLRNLVRQTSVNGIIALGMTFVIISGGIDLSVGSVVGVSSIVISKLLVSEMGILPALLIALVVSTALGMLNGWIIHYGKVPPFIATLGMMQAARGIVMLLSNARMIAGLPKAFTGF
ncbi:MAG: ABC transporter permease, partial [Sphaerochaeta sp.]|nr:ABC transporter permease [Sphaerochaeta sp.]